MDQELEGSLGWQDMMVQLYGFEFDDGFLANDIFSMKNVAEYQKYEEQVWKELEMAEDENLANPTTLLLSFVKMLRHLEMHDKADRIQDAILNAIAKGEVPNC